jgi:hypothetical protein
MPDALIEYTFDAESVSNPDGSFPITFKDAAVVPGPGAIAGGNFPNAVDLGATGRGAVAVDRLKVDLNQFSIRVIFQANGPVTARQNLVESDLLPFALFLSPRSATEFDLVASVAPRAHGWRSATTRFAAGLKPGTWYVADLVYDVDTLGVFVDGQIVSVHAFSAGTVVKFTGHELFVGTWVDGARDHFDGKLAAFKWQAGIPDALHAQLDERRTRPEWFITHKVEMLRSTLDMGEARTRIDYDGSSGAYIQLYAGGLLMYHDSTGTAFEMHGAILAHYLSLRDRGRLGYLVSDEVPSTMSGGRKSVFEKGAIYWSPGTRAVHVVGQMYLDYEALGEARRIGFPVSPASPIEGGLEQQFQGARMYYKNGDDNAHEVHGAILTKYLALGGPAERGFPVTHETDVRKQIGSGTRFSTIGKFSEFERCTIYWSSQTGAFEVHGDIRRKYLDMRGPAGELGFPTSDELNVPGTSGAARFNTFQHGSLVWYGNFDSIVVARPFQLFISRIDARESEGLFRGQNDMYFYIKVFDGGQLVFDRRRPTSGDFGGQNIVDLDFRIPVVITPNANKTVTFEIDVWEADSFDDDDHLGKWTKVLNASNAWGLRENGGILDSGSFSGINSIKVAVQPVVDMNTLSETEKFWGVANKSTDDISHQQYAAAFSDVDSETEWWDVTDWLDTAFYEWVVKDLAESGNCFGMSLEAIYSRKNASLFSMPLNRFTNFGVIEPEVNVRHCYQVGAGPVWWFVKEFLTGNTHDPKDVFRRSRDEFNRGSNPVICIAQNYDFSGAPHCILPIAWDSSSKPWRITISDPNFPNALKTLTVDPDANTFRYVGSNTYTGGEFSGGRFHFMPFSLLSTSPRTPVWDAILLILAGALIIIGEDGQTQSITDGAGRDLDGLGNRALNELRQGRNLQDFFVPFKGYDASRTGRQGTRVVGARGTKLRGKGTVPGEIMMRRRLESGEASPGFGTFDPGSLSHLTISAMTATRAMRGLRESVLAEGKSGLSASERTLHHLAADPQAMRQLAAAARDLVRRGAREARPGDFRHTVVGLRRGSFKYAVKHALTEFRLGSTLLAGEQTRVSVEDIGTSTHMVGVRADRNKPVALEVTNKLGVAGDYVRVRLDRIPTQGNAELQLNLKPGLGGIELLTNGQRVEAHVNIESRVSGRLLRRGFNVPLEGGTRLKLSSILSQNLLGVSRIDTLFGPGKDQKLIRGS